MIERPEIYQHKYALPPFLTRGEKQLLLLDANFVKEGGHGPYDLVIDFANSREVLRGLVPENERITASRQGLKFVSFESQAVKDAMDEITELANNGHSTHQIPKDRLVYRDCLRTTYTVLAKEVKNRLDSGKALVFPPKNGGIFVQEVYEACGFPQKDFFDYRMSRIIGADGRLMVGVRFGLANQDLRDYRQFVFADDCLASDISAYGTLEMIKDALLQKNVSLNEVKVIVAVSAASQRGVESIFSEEAKKHFGFGSLEGILGVPVYRMSENYYLLHPDGRYVVGDMGKWSLPA